MIRIFTVLATANAAGLIASFTLGWVSKLSGGYQESENAYFMVHFLCGLFTAICTLLVHCLVITYGLGTGRWVREVTLVYGLPDAPLYKTTRDLKRATTPLALGAMLGTIAAAALGAGVQLQGWPWLTHLAGACLAIGLNAWAYVVEMRSLRTTATILDAVYKEVDRVRAERGLPSNEEALRLEAELE
jgi:hypothetical protein